MVALPFESPKLTAMAVTSMDGNDFATMLERAIARSREPPRVIEHRPDELPVLEPRRGSMAIPEQQKPRARA